MERNVFKLKEVIALLKTGQAFNMTVGTYDERRAEKSGRKLELRGVTPASIDSYGKANGVLANGQPFTFHPILITKFNGIPVIP